MRYSRERRGGKAADGDQPQHHAGDVAAVLGALGEDLEHPAGAVGALGAVSRPRGHGGRQRGCS